MVSLNNKKIGVIGVGNMGQAMIKAFVESKKIDPQQIYVTNRSPGRLEKVKTKYGVQIVSGNDELVSLVDIVILAVKPQDMSEALEPCRQVFSPHHTIVSIAAGLDFSHLRRWIAEGQLCRVMMNTPIYIQKGTVGYCCQTVGAQEIVENLFSCMGQVIHLEEGDPFEAFTVASSSGTGFIYELMTYWQEWIEEHGIEADVARQIVVQTFLGSAALAEHSTEKLEELQNRVSSKKGMTAAGLESMRTLEIEGLLRMSFNKAALKYRELGQKS